MIYISRAKVKGKIRQYLRDASEQLTTELTGKPVGDRKPFIEDKADSTWRDKEFVKDLVSVIGRKCWYMEVFLEGADPNVDHHRPWGRISEFDANYNTIPGSSQDGYWWLALEWRNFRLSSQHANQRRRDLHTVGGKSDYFPVLSSRAPEKTPYDQIQEDALALDPCCKADTMLLAFDKNGVPMYSTLRQQGNNADRQRVEVSIRLYHLDKSEIVLKRGKAMEAVSDLLRIANNEYMEWARDSSAPSLSARKRFEEAISGISELISDEAEFSGAKRWVIRLALAKYSWIDEFLML